MWKGNVGHNPSYALSLIHAQYSLCMHKNRKGTKAGCAACCVPIAFDGFSSRTRDVRDRQYTYAFTYRNMAANKINHPLVKLLRRSYY